MNSIINIFLIKLLESKYEYENVCIGIELSTGGGGGRFSLMALNANEY